MRQHHSTFRLTAAIAVGGLMFGDLSTVAQAQPAPPSAAQAAPPAAGDPPSRVGVLSRISGTVSFHTSDEAQWNAATLNYPVTSGNAFWTEPNAEADIDIGSTRMVLAPQTEFDVDTLADHALAATEVRGELYLRLRDLAQGDTYAVTTPRGTVTLAAAGRYDIVAGDTDHPTMVTVVDGAAEITGTNLSLKLGAHQSATVTGTDTFLASIVPEADDAFLRAQLARERPAPPHVAATSASAPPPVVAEMTGAEALLDVGEWTEAPQYGHVWYPPVQHDWVPYRHGHWAWVAPWGWTWVDDAAWGFAPSHYGRWVEVNDRWGWTPVPVDPGGARVVVERPVYAPAMVSFVDIAAGAAVGVAAGLAVGAAVGWIPLGPREPYIPPYRVSNGYLARVNVTNVTNITNITNIRNNPPPLGQFANRSGATVVPGATMAESRPVAAAVRPMSPQVVAAARPVDRAPLAPTLATVGVTPAVARQFNLATPAGGVPARPAAPGPAVRPLAQDFGRGPLRPASATAGPPAATQAAIPAAPGAVEPARPGISPGAAVVGGAVVGGAAALGGAALLNRPRPTPGGPVMPATARPGPLPALTSPAAPAAPGSVRPGAAMPATARPALPAAPGPALTAPALTAPAMTAPATPAVPPATASHPVPAVPGAAPATTSLPVPGGAARPATPAATAEPATPAVTSRPAPPTATARPAAPAIAAPPPTARPVAPAATARPVTPAVTAQPATPAVTARPATPAITAQPATPAITAQPATPAVTAPPPNARPVAPAATGRPVTPAVTTRPAAPAITAQPATPAVVARPVTPAVTARPATPAVMARPAAPAEEHPPAQAAARPAAPAAAPHPAAAEHPAAAHPPGAPRPRDEKQP